MLISIQMWPMLASMPIICWMGHGNPIAYVLGSGNQGFGFLTLSLDWNYLNTGILGSPMYTPLWSFMTQCAGVAFACWILYPILYYTKTLDAQTFAAMSSGTFDKNGSEYNTSRVLTADYRLDQAGMDAYSRPYWGVSYVLSYFVSQLALTVCEAVNVTDESSGASLRAPVQCCTPPCGTATSCGLQSRNPFKRATSVRTTTTHM
jgi:hypothetical protein